MAIGKIEGNISFRRSQYNGPRLFSHHTFASLLIQVNKKK